MNQLNHEEGRQAHTSLPCVPVPPLLSLLPASFCRRWRLPMHRTIQVTYAKPGRLSAGMTCAVDIAFTPKVGLGEISISPLARAGDAGGRCLHEESSAVVKLSRSLTLFLPMHEQRFKPQQAQSRAR